MEFMVSILGIIVSFFSFILVLRAWLEFCRVSPSLPISQSILRMTQPVVGPVSRVIPNVMKGRLNIAAILIAIVIAALFYFFAYNNQIPIQTAVLIGVLSVVKTFGQILFFTTLIRALMSWVTQGNHPLDYTIAQITDPALNLIKRIIPSVGMLDFSVMILGIILLVLNNVLYNVFGVLWAIA